MRPFRKVQQPKSFEQIEANAKVAVEQRRENNRNEGLKLLTEIGEITDELADKSLEIIGKLPGEERTIFMHRVFRRLVAQTLFNTDSLDSKNIQSLQYSTYHNVGISTPIVFINGNWESAVVGESLTPQQAQDLDVSVVFATEDGPANDV